MVSRILFATLQLYFLAMSPFMDFRYRDLDDDALIRQISQNMEHGYAYGAGEFLRRHAVWYIVIALVVTLTTTTYGVFGYTLWRFIFT